ncbi:2OG-Fe(II) oxygenase superfamily-domain containing protein [Nitzschia inconspicua]|uniref:2OG-Fe(II) oxygenase superfamily-domain containing protein n=1 Tax=Nitzschia inconspicua TaxID=303405 RepID=A0A9K3KTE7_9STRA|nr:2OG-Fe(II) oxygenase superfamily-domain containing protein [Nitzschia inconspicua]
MTNEIGKLFSPLFVSTGQRQRSRRRIVRFCASIAVQALLFQHTCHGLQPTGYKASNSSSSSSCVNPDATRILNHDDLLHTIHKGRVYQHDNFLTETQVKHLLDEIETLREDGKFITKGLSNTANQVQQFSVRQDRSICPVPWFVDALQTQTPSVDEREGIPAKLQQLQLELSMLLDRPTMADPSLNHECYFSLSNVGSFLPRHMDERHEELKGAQGWLLLSRRSLSWLIYLSEPADWDVEKNGGALRTFPQHEIATAAAATTTTASFDTSTHEGNLQVGWIQSESDDDGDKTNPSKPVYLDSFHRPPGSGQEPYCVMYTIQRQGRKEFVTKPWLTEVVQGMTIPEFLKACAEHDAAAGSPDQLLLFVSTRHARRFHLIEDRQAWEDGQLPKGSVVEDIAPVRGRLVVFDSVQLPHEVREIKSGTRRALAGWFHEKTQELQL